MSLCSFARHIAAVAPLLAAPAILACDDSTAPGPDLIVFVDNPESIQAGRDILVRVVVANPAAEDLTGVEVGTCVRKPSLEACEPTSMVEIGGITRHAEAAVNVPTVADAEALGLTIRSWELIACARRDAQDVLQCAAPVTLLVRPNPSQLCNPSLMYSDTVVAIDPTLRCTVAGDTAVAWVWLEYGSAYGLFFYDGSGEHVPAGGYIDEVYSQDGWDQQLASIAGLGDGFAPPSTGAYFVVISYVAPGTEGFAAATRH